MGLLYQFPANHSAAIYFSRLDFVGDEIDCYLGFDFVAAREKVKAHGIVFRPSVDGQMRFGNHHNSREAMWRELMKATLNHGRPGHLGSSNHDRFQDDRVCRKICALKKIDKPMPAENFRWSWGRFTFKQKNCVLSMEIQNGRRLF